MNVRFEIIDENGNIHGPFMAESEAACYVESRALGEERDLDGDSESGWYRRAVPRDNTTD